MTKFILRRLGYGSLVLMGIIIIIFFLFQVLPGDPARLTLGQRADVMSLQAIRQELGLDQPIYIQFGMYLNDISPVSIHEDTKKNQKKYEYTELFPVSSKKVLAFKTPYLRRSYQTRRRVSTILIEAIPNTVILAFSSMIFASIVGIFLGVIAAIKKNSLLDQSSVFLSVLGISTPSFFASILMAYIFGFLLSDYTGLNMTGSLYETTPAGKTLELKNLILPMLTLGIRPLAIIVQLTRSAMLDVLTQDYIRTAVAKGLVHRTVLFKHALRNALNPVLTAISGWFAALLAGAFFVELIFNWNGIGLEIVNALKHNDFPVVMGGVLFIATIFVTVNILVDILYGLLDPRVSIKG